MDVKHLARSLGITQQSVITRASELLRLLKLQAPGSLGQGEICRPAVCLELACQTTPGSSLPHRGQFIRFSCSPPKVYSETFTRVQRLLDLRPALDLEQLVTLFGCTQLQTRVQELVRAYRVRFAEQLNASGQSQMDFSRPVFLAAAFALIARKYRAKVDRALLLTKMGLTRQELAGTMEDMEQRCGDLLADKDSDKAAKGGEATAKGRSAARKGRKAGAGGEGGSEDEDAAAGLPGKKDAETAAVEDLMLVLTGKQRPAAAGGDGPSGNGSSKRRATAGGRTRSKRVGKGTGEAGGGEQGPDGETAGPSGPAGVAVQEGALEEQPQKKRRLRA